MSTKLTALSEEDLRIVSYQIGKIPKNMKRVAYRCSYGFPVVVESYPILDGKPFPTIYWLTCPHLRYQISKLESNGEISRFEKLLSNTPQMYAEHIAAHLKSRKKAIDLAIAINAPTSVAERLSVCGMGGITNFQHVKCLHMHVAYHIGGIENPIGKMVLSEIKGVECTTKVCKMYKEER